MDVNEAFVVIGSRAGRGEPQRWDDPSTPLDLVVPRSLRDEDDGFWVAVHMTGTIGDRNGQALYFQDCEVEGGTVETTRIPRVQAFCFPPGEATPSSKASQNK